MQIGNYINLSGNCIPEKVEESLRAKGLSEITNLTKRNHSPLILCLSHNSDMGKTIQHLSLINVDNIIALFLERNSKCKEFQWSLLGIGVECIIFWTTPTQTMNSICGQLKRWEKINEILNSEYVKKNLIGASKTWNGLLKKVIEVAIFSDSAILFIGESGTGKEMLARLVHAIDEQRKKNNIILLDCTTIMPELWGSEFFGHEKGAFTGAISSREGAFAMANSGSLFLDEVGELPLNLQSALLRVIEEGIYKKVGCDYYKRTDFRLICATNKDLSKEVENGKFRKDLFYRISTWIFNVPSLKERKEDIPLLTDHFINIFLGDKNPIAIEEEVYDHLSTIEYLGNIRELKHLISRIATKYIGTGSINLCNIPEADRTVYSLEKKSLEEEFEIMASKALDMGMNYKEIKDTIADVAIKIALSKEKGKNKNTAKKLGVSERTIQLRSTSRKNNLINKALN